MNAELSTLLSVAGSAWSVQSEFDWSRVVMVQNAASIPATTIDNDPQSGVNRGFNLVVLNRRGEPAFYVKCRPAVVGGVGRESRILSALHGDPELSPIVPAVQSSTSVRMQVQVMPYLHGQSLSTLDDALGPAEWREASNGILLTAERIAQRAGARCPEDLPAAAAVSIADQGAVALEYLLNIGLSVDDAAALHAVTVTAGLVPQHFQHGDLWSANIIKVAAGWRILDFEQYGVIQVPLFDAFHLVRFAPGMRGAMLAGRWVNAMLGESTPWAIMSRQVIRETAERHRLSEDVINGALAFYLPTMAASLRRRGNPSTVWAPVLLEAQTFARHLRSGGSLKLAFR